MSLTQDLIASGQAHQFRNYRQPDFVLAKGEGAWVEDLDGKRYLDLIAGIATCGLGHRHPKVAAAVHAQVDKLWHVSNLYWTEPAIRLAEKLTATSFADRVFFCNSGAEANEGAIKLARRYHHDRGEARHEILAFEHSFHGRTMGALAATGQPKYHEGFGPMPAGFVHVPYGDLEAVRAKAGAGTAAIMLEPLQGEAGILAPPEGFLAELRKLCDELGALLILDEVQSGMGRTGKLWAHEWTGVTPDIMTSAKALGSGLPIGALLATEEVAKSFVPGTHASTFGGNPVACASALATLEVLLDDGALEAGARAAAHLREQVESELVGKGPVTGVRGQGMWLGLLVESGARDLLASAMEAGVLVNAIGQTILRLAPPLTLTEAEIDEAVGRLAQAWNR